MKQKSMTRNFLFNSIYQVLNILLPFITTPYISRVLRAEGVGAYSYTLAIASYMGIFITIGMDIYGQIQVAKYRTDKAACSGLVVGIFLAKCLASVFVIGIYCLLEPKLNMYQELYWVMILYFFTLIFDFTWLFQGLEEFGYIIVRNIIVRFLGIVGLFLFVKDVHDVVIYAVIVHGTTILGNVLAFPYFRKIWVWLPLQQIHVFSHVKGGFIYFIPTIATSVYTHLDKFMIGWITKSSYENGYYAQSYKIIQMALVVITSVRTVTLPRITNLFHDKNYEEIEKIVDKSIRCVLCLALPMMFGIISVAPELIPIFLGKGYEECILLVRILAVLIVILGLSTLISGQCLTALERQKQANWCVIVGAGINFVLNSALIPKHGAIGAVVASVCAESVILMMFILFSRRVVNLRNLVKNLAKYFSFALIMLMITIQFSRFDWPMTVTLLCKVFVGVASYLAVMMITRDEMVHYLKTILLSKIKKST